MECWAWHPRRVTGGFNVLSTIAHQTAGVDGTNGTTGGWETRERDYRFARSACGTRRTGMEQLPGLAAQAEGAPAGQRSGRASPPGLASYLVSVLGEAGEAGLAKEEEHGIAYRHD